MERKRIPSADKQSEQSGLTAPIFSVLISLINSKLKEKHEVCELPDKNGSVPGLSNYNLTSN